MGLGTGLDRIAKSRYHRLSNPGHRMKMCGTIILPVFYMRVGLDLIVKGENWLIVSENRVLR